MQALTQHSKGNTSEAIRMYSAILASTPTHCPSLNNLGILLHESGRFEEAERMFRAAAGLRPLQPSAWRALALLYLGSGRVDEAEALLRTSLVLMPDDPVALSTLGRLLFEHRKGISEAAALYGRARRLTPDAPEYVGNHGALLRLEGRFQEALDALKASLCLDPAQTEALTNLGSTQKTFLDLTAATRSFRWAGRLAPETPGIQWNESLTLLLDGQMTEGWKKYAARWQIDGFPSPKRQFVQPPWRGEDLTGKTLLIYWEQGLGDTLQFVRYAPLLAARGVRIILDVQRPLVRLFRTVPGVAEVIPSGDPLPPFDYHAPVVDLPERFGTTLETIPANVPYFKADPALSSMWRTRLEGLARPGAKKIGIVWAGSTTFEGDRFRSPGLTAFRPLLDVPGTHVFSLQKGPGHDQLKASPDPMPETFTDLDDAIGDFADTAAILDNLDLMISSCTSVVHLAGGMNTPMWVVIPYSPDFRWLVDREDSPWYPRARLFRQDAPGQAWTGVVARVRDALAAWSAS